jgi:hypothetical protein
MRWHRQRSCALADGPTGPTGLSGSLEITVDEVRKRTRMFRSSVRALEHWNQGRGAAMAGYFTGTAAESARSLVRFHRGKAWALLLARARVNQPPTGCP